MSCHEEGAEHNWVNFNSQRTNLSPVWKLVSRHKCIACGSVRWVCGVSECKHSSIHPTAASISTSNVRVHLLTVHELNVKENNEPVAKQQLEQKQSFQSSQVGPIFVQVVATRLF
jgi:hypothetical protein